MEGRALINDPMDHFSEGDCLQRWLLPDASTGLSPGTLARSPERSEGSRCKEGMARVFAVMVQILLNIARSRYKSVIGAVKLSPVTNWLRHWRSVAVQTISKAVIYQGAGF